MAGVENDFECVYITKQAALNLLDEIDAAHERELGEAQGTAVYMPNQCVKLPVDADGEPIHPGDVIEDDKHTYTVTSITFNSCGAVVRGCTETNRNEWPIDQTSRMHHVKHTTVEVEDMLKEHRIRYYDLVTDMERKRITNDEYARGIKSLDAEYTKRIREVVEHERI
jgi:hypothetical protein